MTIQFVEISIANDALPSVSAEEQKALRFLEDTSYEHVGGGILGNNF